MDANSFLEVFQSFGVSLSAGAFLEFLKAYFQTRKTEEINEFRDQLQAFLNLNGVSIKAETIIDAFAHKGLLTIQQSHLYAGNKIVIGAAENSQFKFGNNSISETSKTKIVAQGDAQIVGSNSAIVQNPDGSISFLVGKKND